MYIYTGHANGKAREIGGYRKEKQPTDKRWGAYKKKEDERRIAHKGQNSVEKSEHKESNLEKDLFKAKLC